MGDRSPAITHSPLSFMPLFTIITICLNDLDGLKRTAKTVQGQSCTDYEWIVIDGGSKDGTAGFLKDIKPAIWVSEPDHGLYDAMNKGLVRAGGDYVLFLNAGDALVSSKVLERLKTLIEAKDREAKKSEVKNPEVKNSEVKNSEANRPDFIYGDALERVGGKSHIKKARGVDKAAWGMFTHHQAMIYRRESLTKHKIMYNPAYEIAADYDFTLRILSHVKDPYYWPHPVCVFQGGGLSQKSALTGRIEQFQIRRALGTVSPYVNAFIFVMQSVVYALRRVLPGLYWRLKRI